MAAAAAAAAGVWHSYLLLLLLLLTGGGAAAGGCSSTTFSNRAFAACNDLPHLSSSIHWTYDSASSSLTLAFIAPPASPGGWVSWAINPTSPAMIGAQSLIAYRRPNGSMAVVTINITASSIKPSPIAYRTSDLAAEYAGGAIRMFGKVYLPEGTRKVNQVWQVGADVADSIPGKHAFGPDNLAAKGTLDLVLGRSSSVADSGLKDRNIHGVLNAVSWGILLPIGAIMARYLKTFKSADPAWFYLHVSCQIIGYGVGVAGWVTGLNIGKKSEGVEYTTHRNIGITLFCLGTLQVFALLLRPKKDHKYRLYWNVYHHSVGYTVIILGVINVFKGLQILSPLHKWKEAYIITICILGCIALLLEAFTWIIVLKRRNERSTTAYNGAHVSNAAGFQQPFSI